jgi:hypothetical protein
MPKDLVGTLDIFIKILADTTHAQDNNGLKLECLFELYHLIPKSQKVGSMNQKMEL